MENDFRQLYPLIHKKKKKIEYEKQNFYWGMVTLA